MPHSVRDQTATQNHTRRDDQARLTLPSSAPAENAAQHQSPMLKAWRDELDPKNLTINEALFLGGLTSVRAEVPDAGGSEGASVTRLSE